MSDVTATTSIFCIQAMPTIYIKCYEFLLTSVSRFLVSPMSVLAFVMAFSAEVWAFLASTKACSTVSAVVFTPSAWCLHNNEALMTASSTNNSIPIHYNTVLNLTTSPFWHPAAVVRPCGHHPASAAGWHPHLKGCGPAPWFHQRDAWFEWVKQEWRAPTHGLPLPQYCLGLRLPLREIYQDY